MSKITRVKYEDTLELDYKHPASFYIRDATGDFVYIHTRDRAASQEIIDQEYGAGKYRVQCAKQQKQTKPLTCR